MGTAPRRTQSGDCQTDHMIIRLRQFGQDLLEEQAEEQLARDATQHERLEEERQARRGAEAATVEDASASRVGRQRGISEFQAQLRERQSRSASGASTVANTQRGHKRGRT